MQLKPGRWMRFSAEHEAAAERVEFSWQASFPLLPLVALRAEDAFRGGQGVLAMRLLRLPIKRFEAAEVTRERRCASWPSCPGCPRRSF